MAVHLQAILFAILMIVISIKDIQKREIPPLFCVGVSLLAFLDFRFENLLGLGIPLVLWLSAVYICPEKLGGGDIKLCFATSLVLGFSATAYGIIIAFSMVVANYLIMRCFQSKKELASFALPFAPFLAVGFLITYFMKLGGAIL